MRHMLDTNIVSHLFKRHPEVVSRMTCLAPGDVCISSITEAELLYGADKKKSSRLKETIREFLNTITICDWDSDAAATYGELRATLEKKGKVMGDLDQLIAAHAISREQQSLLTIVHSEWCRSLPLRTGRQRCDP